MQHALLSGGFLPAKYSSWFIFDHNLSGFQQASDQPYINFEQGAHSNSTHGTGGYYSSLPAQFVALNTTEPNNVVDKIFRKF